MRLAEKEAAKAKKKKGKKNKTKSAKVRGKFTCWAEKGRKGGVCGRVVLPAFHVRIDTSFYVRIDI